MSVRSGPKRRGDSHLLRTFLRCYKQRYIERLAGGLPYCKPGSGAAVGVATCPPTVAECVMCYTVASEPQGNTASRTHVGRLVEQRRARQPPTAVTQHSSGPP